MKFIKINSKLRISGRHDQTKRPIWWTTTDFIIHFVRNGKILNTGLNVFDAKTIIDKCNERKKDNMSYIDLEESQYNLLMEDLKNLNFTQIGLVGVAIVEDIRNITEAKSEKPIDFDTKLELQYPDSLTIPNFKDGDLPMNVKIYNEG